MNVSRRIASQLLAQASQATSGQIQPRWVRWTKATEKATALDPAVSGLSRLLQPLMAREQLVRLLQGRWLGHALHPMLTDVPIGLWTSATMLDLVGGRRARPAAQRLIGLGLMATGSTMLTGMVEWATATDRRVQRVGVVHATANGVAASLYAASWLARRSDQHGRGVLLALAAGSAAGVGGYLGGHLTEVRKVSSYNEAFDAD